MKLIMSTTRGDGTEHPDTLHLNYADQAGENTGITAASIAPDVYQTANGDIIDNPHWNLAELLAAAPEMLAALRIILDAAGEAFTRMDATHPAFPAIKTAHSAAKAAIARARGGEP